MKKSKKIYNNRNSISQKNKRKTRKATAKHQLIVHPEGVRLGDFRSSIGVYPQVSINRDFSSSIGGSERPPWYDKSEPHGIATTTTKKLKTKLNKELTALTIETLFALFSIHQTNKAEFTKAIRKLAQGHVPPIKLKTKDINNLFNKLKAENLVQQPAFEQDSVDMIDNLKQQGGQQDIRNLSGTENVLPEGPYLQRLTTKGDKPITGDDMAKAMDEIITILNDMQYLQEDGGSITMPINALLNYFNGNTEPLQYYLRYYKGPQFYSIFPPNINFSNILQRFDNIIDVLNIYKNDKQIKQRYAVEYGLKPESVLNETPFDKIVGKIDNLDQKINQLKQYRRLQFY
jgi:hypothetical protein